MVQWGPTGGGEGASQDNATGEVGRQRRVPQLADRVGGVTESLEPTAHPEIQITK